MKTNYKSHHARFLSKRTLISVAAVILLACSQNALAQATPNKIPKWTDNTGALGPSTIFEDTSGKVGIGTTGPGGKLEVVGAPTDRTIVASVAPTAAGQAGKFNLKSSYDATSAVFDAARITVYGSTGGYGNSDRKMVV